MNMTLFDIHSHVHGMKYEHTITCGHHDIMTSIAYEYCMLLSAVRSNNCTPVLHRTGADYR